MLWIKIIVVSLNLKYSSNIHLNIFIIVLSPEEMPNVSPTDLMNQDTLMLSNQTMLSEEYIQKEEGNLKIKRKWYVKDEISWCYEIILITVLRYFRTSKL